MDPRPYERLSENPDFQEFIMEMVTRLGLTERERTLLQTPESYQEFAKCFVTPGADPHFNFGLYNLSGDTYVVGAIVTYFLTKIQYAQEVKEKRLSAKIPKEKFKPSSKLVDYFSKLKAKYVSIKVFNDISKLYGFEEFIVMGQRDQDDDLNDRIASDCLLAFMGCFELIVDRYVSMNRSHIYVKRFVNTMFDQLGVNYHPHNVYDYVTLLKETNDFTQPQNSSGYRYEVGQDKNDPNTTVLERVEYRNGIKNTKEKKRIEEVGIIYQRSEESKIVMSQRAYEWIKRLPDRPISTIRLHPTAEELNIEYLC